MKRKNYKKHEDPLLLFFEESNNIDAIACHDAMLEVECLDTEVMNIFISLKVSIKTLRQILEDWCFYLEHQITIPKEKPYTITEVYLDLKGSSRICQKLTKELSKHPDKNPAEVLAYQPEDDFLPFHELVWYNLESWSVKETEYY